MRRHEQKMRDSLAGMTVGELEEGLGRCRRSLEEDAPPDFLVAMETVLGGTRESSHGAVRSLMVLYEEELAKRRAN